MPTVSVIIPCFNQGCYLAESIGSVLASDFNDLEIVVVDDGSCDPETCITLESLDYPKTRLIRQANAGLAAARNSGIAEANGIYILALDADDRIGQQYISQAVATLQSDQTLGIVYCRAWKFGAEQGEWCLPVFSRVRMMFGNIIFCSAIYRRADWLQVKGYDESFIRGWEDWDFWLSLLELGRTVRRLPQVGFYYRKSPESMATCMAPELKAELHCRIVAKHSGFFGLFSLLTPVFSIYYRLASGAIYRTVKKGLGR